MSDTERFLLGAFFLGFLLFVIYASAHSRAQELGCPDSYFVDQLHRVVCIGEK